MKKLLVISIISISLLSAVSAQTKDEDEEVENITLRMDFGDTDISKVIIDGTEYSSDDTTVNSFDFGYIVNASPLGIVSHSGDPIKAKFDKSEDVISLTQEKGDFFVPNTQGGSEVIEERQDLIQAREFMQTIDPSFGFTLGAERIIRVSYEFPYEVHEVKGPSNGIQKMLVQNRIHPGNETQLVLDTE